MCKRYHIIHSIFYRGKALKWKKTYQAGTNEGIVDFINMEDLEIAASQVIPAGGYGYISSEVLATYLLIKENERAFNHQLIIPHVLRDVELPDTTTHFDKKKR